MAVRQRYVGYSLRCLILSAPVISCSPPEIQGIGQYGRPIPLLLSEDMIPRLMLIPSQSNCPGSQGPCSQYYDGPPSLYPNDSCSTVVLDTGTVLTTIPKPSGGKIQLERECLEVRSGSGFSLIPGEQVSTLDDTVTRFRFNQLPIFRIPTTSSTDEYWRVGRNSSSFVGGVVGANLLRNFAVRFRHIPSNDSESSSQATVQIYGLFPGSETNLANRGLAYIRTQYPNRLLGRRTGDRCALGPDIDCNIDQIFELDAQDEQQIYESSRMVIDACIAPPRCGIYYGAAAENELGCVKNSVNPFEVDQISLPVDSCIAPSGDTNFVGRSASLIASTAIEGAVLFSDSFARMYGPVDALPQCDASTPIDLYQTICKESVTQDIHVPGWSTITPQATVRIRSISLVSGLKTASGVSPCFRVAQRMEGLLEQCNAYDKFGRPTHPATASDEKSTVTYNNHSVLTIGDVYGSPSSQRWIVTSIVSSASHLATSIRADVSGIAIEPDGFIGSEILRNNDIVFDYTEEKNDPGIRARCLSPDDGSCISIPVCTKSDRVGERSCCYGLPQNLLVSTIQANGEASQECCTALSRSALNELQLQDPPRCVGVEDP